MRFMVITKATADSEAGVLPATEDFDTMGKFIQELVDAGVLLAADGPDSPGLRAGHATSAAEATMKYSAPHGLRQRSSTTAVTTGTTNTPKTPPPRSFMKKAKMSATGPRAS